MRLNQCGGDAAHRGQSHLKCQQVRGEQRVQRGEWRRVAADVSDADAALVRMLLSRSRVVKQPRTQMREKKKKKKSMQLLGTHHRDGYIPHASLDQGKCDTGISD